MKNPKTTTICEKAEDEFGRLHQILNRLNEMRSYTQGILTKTITINDRVFCEVRDYCSEDAADDVDLCTGLIDLLNAEIDSILDTIRFIDYEVNKLQNL